MQRAITPKTRAIIINTPNNPTASVLSGEDMRMLEGMLRGTDIVVISDEVYEHIVFDGHQHQSVARYPGLAERSFIVSSFGKTYHVTGWKMGYVLAPKELMTEFRKVHQFNVFVTNGPLQYAFAEYMENPDAYLSLAAFYQKKRDFFLEGVKGSRFKPLPSRGTFFQNLRLRRDQRREGHRPRDPAHEGARRRLDPGVGVLPRAAGAQGAAVLLREVGGDAGAGAEILCKI